MERTIFAVVVSAVAMVSSSFFVLLFFLFNAHSTMKGEMQFIGWGWGGGNNLNKTVRCHGSLNLYISVVLIVTPHLLFQYEGVEKKSDKKPWFVDL